MKLGRLLRLSAAPTATILAAALVVAGCSTAPYDFDIQNPGDQPRVSAIHRPLHPAPGEAMRIIARPENLGGGSVTVTLAAPGQPLATRTCRASQLAAGECVLDVAAGLLEVGVGLYSAEIVRGGVERRSPGTYTFQIGTPPAPERGARVIPLRVPLEQTDRFHAVLLVADMASFDSDFRGHVAFGPFSEAIEPLIYDTLLDDPAYRWRDNQVGFYATERAGQVSDYYSGLSSRCGADPWVGLAQQGFDISAETDVADAIGVLHRQDFRDCSGLGTLTAGGDVPHFSADVRRPLTFQHELGHALFGLADEYWESEATRRAPPGAPQPCCCPDGGPGDGGRGIIGPGGGPGGPDGLPCIDPVACDGRPWPAECAAAPAACPPIASSCVEPNVFATRDDCASAAAAIVAHPGIALDVGPDDCRLLCAPADGVAPECPCDPDRTVWILDRRTPPVPGAAPDDDIMGVIDERAPRELHGPACALCIETELCLLWERGSGRDEAEARARCIRPGA